MDPTLAGIARRIEEPPRGGDLTSFGLLADQVYEQVESFAQPLGLPATAGFYYEDAALAARYSETQTQVLPQRAAVGERMAAWIWNNISPTGPVRLIDLGTGDGSMAELLAIRRPKEVPATSVQLVASDRSAAMLDAHRGVFERIGARTLSAENGDLGGDAWCSRETYRRELGARWEDFPGFDGIACHSTLHLVPDRKKLYAGVRSLLTDGGVMAFSCDFLDEDGARPYVLPMNTLLDGFVRYQTDAAVRGTQPVTLIGYLAGFIFRRFFLQGDQLSKLSEESALVRKEFRHCAVERHRDYPEFAILVASESPLTAPADHADCFVPQSNC